VLFTMRVSVAAFAAHVLLLTSSTVISTAASTQFPSLSPYGVSPAAPTQFPSLSQYNLIDASRNRTVRALICADVGNASKRLMVFGPGGGLYGEDYAWLCEQAAEGQLGGIVLALVNPGAGDDPMDLQPQAEDTKFLAAAMLHQSETNHTAPFFKSLGGQVVVAGHSRGGATALLAAVAEEAEQAGGSGIPLVGMEARHAQGLVKEAVVSLAPGVYGEAQEGAMAAASPRVHAPVLLLLGDQDCCNEVHVQSLPIFRNVSSEWKAIVLLRGANHCHWSTPVEGACGLACSSCGDIARVDQQREGTRVILSFMNSVFLGNWSQFETYLRRLHQDGAAQFITQNSPRDLPLGTCCPCNSSNSP